MSKTTARTASRPAIYDIPGRVLSWLNRVPYALLALPLRFAVATVFWKSGVAKLANWETTIALFTDEYQVPLLPPQLAANMALTIELITPVLLALGLFTRVAAFVLLGMTAVIEIFVYPQAWPTHIQWAAMWRARARPSRAALVGMATPQQFEDALTAVQKGTLPSAALDRLSMLQQAFLGEPR